jgi:hypothetical protein
MHDRMRRLIQQKPKVFPLSPGSNHRLPSQSLLELKTTRSDLAKDVCVIRRQDFANPLTHEMKA